MTFVPPLPRSTRFGLVLLLSVIGFVLALAFLFASNARPSSASPIAPAASALVTPTPTFAPTPTPTPDSIAEQEAGISCTPTLTAGSDSIQVYDEVTFTFDDGCVCSTDIICDFVPSNATMTSSGFTLTEPLGSPASRTFTAIPNRIDVIEISVEYDGERRVGNQTFASNLSAATRVRVRQIPVVCDPSLTISNDTPTVGEQVSFTFDNRCTCPTHPDLDCGFWIFNYVLRGPNFDFDFDYSESQMVAGSLRNGEPFVTTAIAAGPVDVTLTLTGQTVNHTAITSYSWTSLEAAVSADVRPAFACEQRAADLSWADAGADKYWVYRTTPNGAEETWIGRTLGATTFTDPNPIDGAAYLVHYAGIARTPCGDLGPPIEPGPALACAADAGVITWNDASRQKYWIYRAPASDSVFAWIGRTLGANEFTDPNPAVGARYQVRFAGARPFECTITAEPANAAPFDCSLDGAKLIWTDHGEPKYWVYRSTDGGLTYTWLGRTLGATEFTDSNPVAGARYQVHYAGIPRVDCGSGL